jgi:[heparan sulfate]-glucosamine 3-sulfotransferase 5
MSSAIENNYTIYRTFDKVNIIEMPVILSRKDIRGEGNCIQRRPEVVMIGVPKCGTGSVRTFLNEHPSVAMEMNSEGVQYFNLRYMRGPEWYRHQMPCSTRDQLTIENSPQYFISEEAPERMFKYNPKMKLILTVRNPISRLESEFVQMAVGRPQFLTGTTIDENVIDPETGKVNRRKTLVSKSIYIRYLKKWLEYFPVEQIHIVDGDEFARNPSEELNKIERFLNVEKFFKKEHFAYVENRGFFCLQRKHSVECLEKGKGRLHPYINPNLMRKLQNFYALFNEELFTTFGRRFNWA